MLSRCAYAK